MLREVTKLRKLETIQKEFVSNVSHELKTPLTIISGYVQALLDNQGYLSENDKQSCLDSILNETDRLSSLITQLLILSRLNENHQSIKKRLF